MTRTKPKWKRRKEARSGEIIEAALGVFAEKGYEAAKLDDIAKRAGVVKGTLYLYFETKEDVFRAVARHAIASNLEAIKAAATTFRGSLAEIIPLLLRRAAETTRDGRIPAILRMVIAESHNFPDLARIWHDDVAAKMLRLLAGIIADAQKRGEIRPGDPKLHAFSILGPIVTGLLFREVFGAFSRHAPNLDELAAQHIDTVMHGLLVSPKASKR